MYEEFTGFKIELVPYAPQTPMMLIIDSAVGLQIELPSTGEFHVMPTDDLGKFQTVMFKMNAKNNKPPEISFMVSTSEIERFKTVSVLPVK